jgi:very-short-patch-repair endonuclease
MDFLTRSELLADGFTRRSLRRAVEEGALIHVRRDRYLRSAADERLVRAVRVGGRLTCLSLLSLMGVFVLENHALHVLVAPGASRLRSAHSTKLALGDVQPGTIRVHWAQESEQRGQATTAAILDALLHAVHCQSPRAMVATLDSALHVGLLAETEIGDVFAALPPRFGVLRSMLDGRAESGPESLVRLMARMLGCDIRIQVVFPGIGRVDLLLDGWLVVECDSEGFHADWASRRVDHARDLALAALGYVTFRPVAEDIMYRPDRVLAALRGLIGSRRTI